MSTRAVYSFIDEHETHHVYKHHDGYPSGAAEWIEKAAAEAWPLPRFEASEFGAAFVAACRKGPGGVRLTHGPEHHGDLAYRYEIRCDGGVLMVKAFKQRTWEGWSAEKVGYEPIFLGTLAEFKAHVDRKETATP